MVFLSVEMGIPFHEVRQWSSAELTLYMCYYRISPWGEERADIRNAMQMAQTANLHRDTARHPNPFEIVDFMPFREQPPEPKVSRAGLRGLFRGLVGKK